MTQLNYADITRTTIKHICGDPQTLADILVTASDEEGGVEEVLDVCDEYGINPQPAIDIALRPNSVFKLIKR